MAPEGPHYEDKPNITDGLDKFMAAMVAVFIMLMTAVAIVILFSVAVGLWEAGIVNALIIIAVFVAMFAIARKLYHYILEKDFL